MKRVLSAVLCIMLLGSLLVGCSPKPAPTPAPAPAPAPAATKVKISMATDMGGVNDASFNQSAWAGLQKLGTDLKDKVDVNYRESTAQEQYAPNLRALVEGGAGLTWAIGYMMAPDLAKTADQFKDKKFAIIDSAPGPDEKAQTNVAYVLFKAEEGSFLAGVTAGMMTKSNKIGFVGGMTGDLIKTFENGFKAGVKSVNKDAQISVAYAESWTDSGKGEQIATGMYNGGADVIFHASGATGKGVFDAAVKKGAGFWVIGVDSDQHALAPNNTLTSMLKRVDSATYAISKSVIDNKFEGGKVTTFSLKDQGVGIGYYTDKEQKTNAIINPNIEKAKADAIKAKVDDYSKKIVAGEVKIPTNDKDYATWLTTLK